MQEASFVQRGSEVREFQKIDRNSSRSQRELRFILPKVVFTLGAYGLGTSRTLLSTILKRAAALRIKLVGPITSYTVLS